jgi:hypothetical protein
MSAEGKTATEQKFERHFAAAYAKTTPAHKQSINVSVLLKKTAK